MSRLGKIELRWASMVYWGDKPELNGFVTSPTLQYREFLDPHEGLTHDVYLGEPRWSEWQDVPHVSLHQHKG